MNVNVLTGKHCWIHLVPAVKQPEGTYRALASDQVVQIHPPSVLFQQKAECIILGELVQTSHKKFSFAWGKKDGGRGGPPSAEVLPGNNQEPLLAMEPIPTMS
ncbi:putative ATP-dependent RNA helicase [Quillaja saponaria]|uniref:ATP-dependent RNA helicase n=1 Tax=Quillaja saponaria TaxID=32244 RepID=A0AAD7P5Z0_QUISA|nr:putative ATP-dependent RNA helicase [Quillaja saponaria]